MFGQTDQSKPMHEAKILDRVHDATENNKFQHENMKDERKTLPQNVLLITIRRDSLLSIS
jgi:hypothetical protein